MITTVTRPNIGVRAEHQDATVELLHGILADLHVLYVRTRNYHWNVVGPQFNDLHKFFEAQYTILADSIDEVAERCRSLGGHAMGTMTEYLKAARLKEQPGDYPEARVMIQNLLADHEACIRALREAVDKTADEYHDMGTSDFLTGLMEGHEKMAWMLRAYLDGKAV